MEKFTQKWAIIIPLEHHEDGAEFYFTEFPLHITLAGVFASSEGQHQLERMLMEIASKTTPFEVIADQEARFGEHGEIAVMKMKQTPELMELYGSIQAELSKHGAVFNSPQYEGRGYIPHSTYQKTGRLHAGEKVIVRAVSLIDLFPNGDGFMRKITKTMRLGEGSF